MPRAEIPPSHLPILSSRSEDAIVLIPDDGLDRAAVDAWADFVARGRVERRGGGGGGGGGSVHARARASHRGGGGGG